MTLYPPPGSTRLLAMREVGRAPEGPVIASFIGHTGFGNLHVYPKSGVTYDWSCTRGLAVHIRLRPGINAMPALASIFNEWEAAADPLLSYPAVIDHDLKQVAFLVGAPAMTWPVKAGSPTWHEFFDS